MLEARGDVSVDDLRYAAWFHELDAWTEYWDIYHPETRGRFYFGDGETEQGLLTLFLPRERRPPVFEAWREMALTGDPTEFLDQVKVPAVSSAIIEVDSLVSRVFNRYFGNPSAREVQRDYLKAMFRCATDSLPPATERDALVADDDWRKPTAGRHMIDSDIMWFAWSLHLEAAHVLAGKDADHARRTLQLAGIATGCAANFAWRGHRRTRAEYRRDAQTAILLRDRGMEWALDFEAAANEVHSLFRIREWGSTE